MKIIDLHADIGNHLYQCRNQANVLKQFHEYKLKKAEIVISSVACYFCGDESWNDMQKMISHAKEEINKSNIKLILSVDDCMKLEDLNLILTVEGMCGIKSDVEDKIQWMYDQGVRIASLCWNDENSLCTGVKGNPSRGLTDLGKKAIRKMNELNMIVDVSHANEKSFWDILDETTKPVIATHSNLRVLANVERNLTSQQFKALANQKGLCGLNGVKAFIGDELKNQDAKQLSNHAKAMSELHGVNHIAIGFDFMDFLSKSESMAVDLKSAEDAQNLILELRERFVEEDVERIAYKNALEFLRTNL